MRIVTPAIESYFASLAARIGHAVPVPYVPAPDAQLAECHTNAHRWIAVHPNHKVVRGWMTWGMDESENCTFIAHSVIDHGGRLFDITPIDINTPRPNFLADHGAREAFDAMQPEWSMVHYPFILEIGDGPVELDDWLEL